MRRTYRRAGLLALLCAAWALTACSTTQTVDPGGAGAIAEPSYYNYAQSSEFETLFAKLDKGLIAGRPVRGTMFKHASYGKRQGNSEWDVELVGKDAASVFVRSRVPASFAGDNLDTLHLAGSKYDYFLLSGRYKPLAPTLWARVPTNYGSPLNVCLVTGYQTICDMEDAVSFTKEEGVKPAKRVVHNGDGTITLITGVTLQSMLKDNFLLNVPSSVSSQFTPDMLKYVLSARFTIKPDGELRYAEIVGVVPGATDFVVQVGYQVTGVPQQSDLPQLPPASQVTTVPHDVFAKRLSAIVNGG